MRNASLINNVEGATPIENFDINDKTELWAYSKHLLGQFLQKGKREETRRVNVERVKGMRQRQKVR